MNKSKLSEHVAKLKQAQKAQPQISKDSLLFIGTPADKEYLALLKPCVGSATTHVRIDKIDTLSQVKIICKQKLLNKVITSSVPLLKALLKWDKKAAPSLNDYMGSYFTIPNLDSDLPDIEIVIVPDLKKLVTVTYAPMLMTRYISKLTKPEKWYKPTQFTGFTMLNAHNELKLFSDFSKAFLISIDIETFKENAVIRCLSYTAFFYTPNGSIESSSVVLPIDSEYNLALMRKWNWQLKAPKVFQNGKYDISYFARYSAPVYNYLYDTAHMFHSWYSELPKDLGFLNAFFIREAMYWKDLSETNDLHEYYRYNALDTWGTGNTFISMLLEAPNFAIANYLNEFPLVFPCHMCEMTGIERDMEAMREARIEQKAVVDAENSSLNRMLGLKLPHTFNVKSPAQMKELFRALGCGDLKSQDEKAIKKASYRHPLNSRVLGKVLSVRKARTLLSNYLTEGKEFSRLDGTGNRFLYSLNPQGTDSSRLASKSHHFWCGDNIQKIPRGKIVKQTFKADPDFLIAEVDLEQAESRDTGYISGDKQLIHNVEFSPDFHKSNASQFFGVPFEEVTKDLRTLAKPVNHGANYNMGAYVLIDTMGMENIAKARQLLGLPIYWSFLQVAEYLLECFHKTYPSIKQVYYKGVVDEVVKTSKLTSLAQHHSWNWKKKYEWEEFKAIANDYYSQMEEKGIDLGAWTRYCFGNPTKSKPVLNSYISHPPQSLNAQTLNRAFMHVFQDIAINPKHSSNFKLLAQIHDSILFQYRIGHEYLIEMVEERMQIPVTVKGYDGEVRTFVVPAGAKYGQHLEGDAKGKATHWSMTE